ncbi:DUF2201 family putative metallopeptidase [Anaeroselena agilis]|uniref:VWA-like domain-containing protein n=1 Tax=Anaeroselena agilis TaxID=3063788 RepID=A0ABU3NSF1_9FIRM|nr:VWA-like domain-containing protein [Selenomonadales bacterium 4137-cl]
MIIPEELQAGRLFLTKTHPYLASALWALQPVAKADFGIMAVDMYWRLYFDPVKLTELPVEVVGGILYHEICHLLRNHPERMKDFNPRLSNIASDAEINDDLLREGVKFPAQPVTPQLIGQPENLLAEEYYYALEKNKPDQDRAGTMPQDNDTGDGTSDGREGSDRTRGNDADGSESDNEKSRSAGRERRGFPSPGSGRCGSCATGRKEEWEEEAPGKGSSTGISKAEGELIRRDVANQIAEYAEGRGRIPGHLARWAQEKLHPKVNWRRKLAAAIRYAVVDQAGGKDYSYRRPSRRQGQIGSRDVIFPSLRCPVPSVAVVADTSASISDRMLAQSLAEIAGILRSLGQREGIHVLAVDAAVGFCRKVFRPEQVRFVGGGGTDMGVGLEAAARLRPLPQLGIVISDGHTAWPESPPPGMKVIVMLTGDGKAPDWANVIQL